MSVNDARKWVIGFSLITTTSTLLFVLLAPLFGYPLDYDQADISRLVQLIIPVTLGYLGTASNFAFNKARKDGPDEDLDGIAVMLVRWPPLVWTLLVVASLVGFGWTNRASMSTGGWTIDFLAWALSISMGLLAVTTTAAAAYLFSADAPK